MLDFFSSFATRPRRPRRVARASQSAEVPSRASEARVTRSRRRDETSHGGMTKKTHVKKFLRRQRRVAENARVAGDRNFARLAQIALAPGQDAGDRAICARAAASRLAKLCAAPELVASKRVRETSLEEGEIVAKVTSRRRGRDGAERPKHASLRRLVYTPWFCTDCGFANDHARGTCARCARATRQLEEGEWICEKCDAHNFKIRVVCRACKNKKKL